MHVSVLTSGFEVACVLILDKNESNISQKCMANKQ